MAALPQTLIEMVIILIRKDSWSINYCNIFGSDLEGGLPFLSSHSGSSSLVSVLALFRASHFMVF